MAVQPWRLYDTVEIPSGFLKNYIILTAQYLYDKRKKQNKR